MGSNLETQKHQTGTMGLIKTRSLVEPDIFLLGTNCPPLSSVMPPSPSCSNRISPHQRWTRRKRRWWRARSLQLSCERGRLSKIWSEARMTPARKSQKAFTAPTSNKEHPPSHSQHYQMTSSPTKEQYHIGDLQQQWKTSGIRQLL